MGEGNIFTLCVSPQRGRVPTFSAFQQWNVPTIGPMSWSEGYPSTWSQVQFLGSTSARAGREPSPWMGYPLTRVRIGGTPCPDQDGGYPQSKDRVSPVQGWGTPIQGYSTPPDSERQSYTASTCYAAFRQVVFLVRCLLSGGTSLVFPMTNLTLTHWRYDLMCSWAWKQLCFTHIHFYCGNGCHSISISRKQRFNNSQRMTLSNWIQSACSFCHFWPDKHKGEHIWSYMEHI